MTDAISQAEAEELMERGFSLLHDEKLLQAFDLGRELEERQFSGGFELQATALNRLNRRDEAIETLERGVSIVPDVWLLWQLLGNFRSDAGNYDGAFGAYEKAAALGGDPLSIAYNYANALLLADRPTEARAKLQPIVESGMPDSTEAELRNLVLALYDSLWAARQRSKPMSLIERLGRAFGRPAA